MSLARALLVLACAAPLLAAPASENGQCASITIGSSTKRVVALPRSVIPAGVQKAKLDIPNNCHPSALMGEEVEVCDDGVIPDVVPPPNGVFTPVTVARRSKLLTAARVYVNQYCH